jgi:hypothetical protein
MIYANIHMEGHQNNSMFSASGGIHRQGAAPIPVRLREKFFECGIEINTPDLNRERSVAFDLFFEGREFVEDSIPKYLVALENPSINRLNENRDYCKRFRKVFAWDKRLHDLPNVVPIMYPHHIVTEEAPRFAEREIFSCLINANKLFRDPPPNDLYQERLATIRWYERHAPAYFELYGFGWQKPAPAYTPWHKLKRGLASLSSKALGHPPFPSYRGTVRDKREVLRRSKFAYCYENTRGPDSYITEKIFDCMMSGCVPVYWGPKNVKEYIPLDCFIDREIFKDVAAVHAHLLSITPERYAQYQKEIAGFLGGDAVKPFTVEKFSDIVTARITQDL